MEQGWVIAKPEVRGGGEKGTQWHQAGKLNNKPQSINDFFNCIEYLIAERVTHPNLLAVKGESAGAIVAG